MNKHAFNHRNGQVISSSRGGGEPGSLFIDWQPKEALTNKTSFCISQLFPWSPYAADRSYQNMLQQTWCCDFLPNPRNTTYCTRRALQSTKPRRLLAFESRICSYQNYKDFIPIAEKQLVWLRLISPYCFMHFQETKRASSIPVQEHECPDILVEWLCNGL